MLNIKDITNTIIQGDCLDVMRDMPDNYVDSIITDPPYGLSFMGKKWDYDVPAVEVWVECLRVLKPGGTLLCFAGSRTQHRMAVNVEDAGFILKDCIMWLYGSGFPKATDISKQLDKDNGKNINLQKFTKWFADVSRGKTNKEIDRHIGLDSNGATASHYRCVKGQQPRFPRLAHYYKLKEWLGFGDVWDTIIEEAEREVIGQKKVMGKDNDKTYGKFKGGMQDITLAATPEAQLWNGWKSHGLKPAYEPILVAMKPNGESALDIFEAVVYTLAKKGFGNISWIKKPAKNATKQKTSTSSTRTKPPRTEETSVESVKRNEMQSQGQNTEQAYLHANEQGIKQTQKKSTTIIGGNKENLESKYSKNMEESVCVAEKHTKSSLPSTTLTETGNSIEIESEKQRSMLICEKEDSQKTTIGSYATTAISLLAVTDTALTITFEKKEYVIEILPDGSFVWPSDLPQYRKARSLTYANNALVHGVSGLNIDGGRIGTETIKTNAKQKGSSFTSVGSSQGFNGCPESEHQGRFPANVILDEEAGRMLDEQSGISTSGKVTHSKQKYAGESVTPFLRGNSNENNQHGDKGGASRFFYCAKASKRERNAGCDGLEEKENQSYGDYQGTPEHAPKLNVKKLNHHPTVKPLALMEYLCTLTKTPTGGIVLEPYAGSGTTCIACVKTGRDYIGIEREAEYCEIARKRIQEAKDSMGLFEAST